ncbi:arginine deiminase-related protein, partial [Vibrio vulnificus]|uniref:arginine deiminase-related protein n=1 Tax=Vibrio vulnificus TaxID=672 RepID=UPI0005024D8F
ALAQEEERRKTLAEFRAMVGKLRQEGVQVVEFDSPEPDIAPPDALSPNNCFSPTAEGGFYPSPRACENRREEVRPQALIEALTAAGREVHRQDSLTDYVTEEAFLESTGVMVIDHLNRTIYAALSQRCDRLVLEEYA